MGSQRIRWLLVTLHGLCHQLSETREKVDAHAGMKTIRIDAADGEEAELRLLAQGHEGCGTDLVGFLAEQEIALCIPHLAAARVRRQRSRASSVSAAPGPRSGSTVSIGVAEPVSPRPIIRAIRRRRRRLRQWLVATR